VPEEYRRDFSLYVDEFQNFATDSFADILSQARKYHLNLIVANQFSTQLKDEIRDSVFGNVGTVVSFRVGTEDAEFLAKQLAPVFDIDDLQFLPNYNTAVRMMIGGVPVQPFSMATLPPLGEPNKQLADALKQLSAAKYGRPKATVEQAIFKRLETKPKAPALEPGGRMSGAPWDRLSMPPSGVPARSTLPPPRPAPSPAGLPPPAARKGGSSFLDEWLAKRQGGASRLQTRAPAPAPPANRQAYQPTGPATSTPWTIPDTPATSQPRPSSQPAQSARPAEPAAAPKTDVGELKIKRDELQNHQPETTVRIDNQGNITYAE
jgi:hypothetical protein